MRTKKIFYSLLFGAGLFFMGCTDGFDSLNTNPNRPTEDMYDFNKADLGASLRNVALMEGAHLHQRVKALGIDVFAQYVGGNATSRIWSVDNGWQEDYWRTHYNNWLAPLNMIIAEAEKYENRANSLALARIWRVYAQSEFTDYFGPCPFPKSPEDENPDYEPLDKQYEFFFRELDEAIALMDPSLDFLTVQDQIYWGDLDKWKRFANSLRLRLAVKMSEVNSDLGRQQAQAALNADGGVMQPGDDARMAGTSGWGNQYNYYMYQISWGDPQVLMTSMEKVLTGIGGMPFDGEADVHPEVVDPRATRLFQASPEDSETKQRYWAGLTPGMRDEVGAPRNRTARMSETYILPNDAREYDIFLYAEVCFLAAEASLRFGTTSPDGKTAKDWYEEGVRASFGYWGLSGEEEEYLASAAKNVWGTSASFEDTEGAGNTQLEKIITQKYIAGYPDLSRQAWNDKRRLNLPLFDIPQYRDPGAGSYPSDGNRLNPANFISRMVYPQNEALINRDKYQAGVALLQGGDKTSSPLWWASKRANYSTSAVQP